MYTDFHLCFSLFFKIYKELFMAFEYNTFSAFFFFFDKAIVIVF